MRAPNNPGADRPPLASALWIARQAATGLCVCRYCDRAGVLTAVFHAWKLKLDFCPRCAGHRSCPGSASAFVRVRVIAEAGLAGKHLQHFVRCRGGMAEPPRSQPSPSIGDKPGLSASLAASVGNEAHGTGAAPDLRWQHFLKCASK